jgi:Ca-activated chloride channel family protein
MVFASKLRKQTVLQDRNFVRPSIVRRGRTGAVMTLSALGLMFASSALGGGDTPSSPKCFEDAMLVFDASGSMSGMEEWGSSSLTTRIDDARKALAESLPRVTPLRRLGLLTYGPGPVGRCTNILLNLRPEFNAGPAIMAEVNAITPDGRTPLTSAVQQAAEVLDYRTKAALVVLLTDGSETCGGQPCALARELKATGKAITVHVIAYRLQDIISTRDQGITDMKCLAAQTGGQFIGAGSIDELIAALNSTLGCPLITQRDVKAMDLARL